MGAIAAVILLTLFRGCVPDHSVYTSPQGQSTVSSENTGSLSLLSFGTLADGATIVILNDTSDSRVLVAQIDSRSGEVLASNWSENAKALMYSDMLVDVRQEQKSQGVSYEFSVENRIIGYSDDKPTQKLLTSAYASSIGSYELPKLRFYEVLPVNSSGDDITIHHLKLRKTEFEQPMRYLGYAILGTNAGHEYYGSCYWLDGARQVYSAFVLNPLNQKLTYIDLSGLRLRAIYNGYFYCVSEDHPSQVIRLKDLNNRDTVTITELEDNVYDVPMLVNQDSLLLFQENKLRAYSHEGKSRFEIIYDKLTISNYFNKKPS